MSYLWSLYISYTFEIDRAGAKVVKHAYTTTDQDRCDIDSNFVNEAGLDGLLQDAGRADHDILISSGLLRLTDRTFHTIRDKSERRTRLDPFLRDVVGDDECR